MSPFKAAGSILHWDNVGNPQTEMTMVGFDWSGGPKNITNNAPRGYPLALTSGYRILPLNQHMDKLMNKKRIRILLLVQMRFLKGGPLEKEKASSRYWKADTRKMTSTS